MKVTLQRSVPDNMSRQTEADSEREALSYCMSHDLQAPLRCLDGFTRLLNDEYGALIPPRGREYIRRISGAAARMRDVIDDLNRLFKVSGVQLTPAPVDLSQMVRSIAGELQSQEPERIVQIRIADGVTCAADPKLLRLAVQNLLANAWKFTSKTPDAYIEFGALPGSSQTYFIRDNGAGFDSAAATEMFAPFQRFHGEDDFPGMGIGLAIVQRVIRKHGGDITAHGRIGEGATFIFSLQDCRNPEGAAPSTVSDSRSDCESDSEIN